MSGVFTRTVKNESDAIGVGDVVLKNGTYFLLWNRIHLLSRRTDSREKVA